MSDDADAGYVFHFSPARGWMNDPNGLIQRDGVHHFFFQHNPEAPEFGRIHWGHATSPDLVHWTERPIALVPGDAGDYDADGCWSGCAVVLTTPDGVEQVALVYSANAEGRQLPAVAFATDAALDGWRKSPANPVVDRWPPLPDLTDFRDHAVVPLGDGWRQVLAAGADEVSRGVRTSGPPDDGGRGGRLVGYRSAGDDLTRWDFEGVFLDSTEAGLPGEVWECPDVFVAEGAAADEVVVVMSWYTRHADPDRPSLSDVLWLTGRVDEGRFHPERYGRLDLGDRFYAPQSYTTQDGRRLMFGWLRTQDDPAAAGRPAVGAATLPRHLTLVDGRLHQQPAAELEALVRTPAGRLDDAVRRLDLDEPAEALELLVSAADPADLASAILTLTGPEGATTPLVLTPFVAPSTYVRDGAGWRPEPPATGRVRVLYDRGLFESFGDDGRTATTSDLGLATVHSIALLAAEGSTAVVEVSVLSGP